MQGTLLLQTYALARAQLQPQLLLHTPPMEDLPPYTVTRVFRRFLLLSVLRGFEKWYWRFSSGQAKQRAIGSRVHRGTLEGGSGGSNVPAA